MTVSGIGMSCHTNPGVSRLQQPKINLFISVFEIKCFALGVFNYYLAKFSHLKLKESTRLAACIDASVSASDSSGLTGKLLLNQNYIRCIKVFAKPILLDLFESGGNVGGS